ncbi:hypothetical protein ACJRO7_010853 [Eucalyptus globulus]|uniref:Dynamin stalk domain-containing protein n=1 Tax=Eucalyptus globulus TaxID=34317 RepID=A0ABD3LDA3_EUCGL
MPKNLSSVEEAVMAFEQTMGSAKESLRKVLLGDEFDEYPNDKDMQCTTRLVKMLNHYANEHHSCTEDNQRTNFLFEEMKVLEEVTGIGLSSFLPRTAFLTLLQQKVLMQHTENYPQLQSSMKGAVSNLINKMKGKTMNEMMKIVEMEKLTEYTCNLEYLLQRNKLMT